MGKGSSGASSAPTSTTVTQNALPAYAQPYFEDILSRSQAESYRPFQGYGGQRIAGPSAFSNQADAMTGQQSGQWAPYMDRAGTDIAGVQGVAGNLANFQASPITSDYSAETYDPTTFNPNAVSTGRWTDPNVAQGYMNPYIQNVLDVQTKMGNRDFQEAQAGRNAQAVKAGAFGGGRAAIADAQARRDQDLRMDAMRSQGLASAYQSGMGQFTADEGRGLQALLANQANDFATQQATEQSRQFGSQFGASTGQAANQARMAAMQASEEARARAAGIQLQGGQFGLQSAAANQALGQARQGAGLTDINAYRQAAALQEGRQQQMLDTGYNDFLQQRDWGAQQLANYNAVLHGLPIKVSDTSTAKYETSNPTGQALGAGIQALGLYKGMTG